MIDRIAWLAVCAALASSAALAQRTPGKAGEVVISAEGTLSDPWAEREVCDEMRCRKIVVNTVTGEVARLDGRLTSPFKATGSGKEVVRAYEKRS